MSQPPSPVLVLKGNSDQVEDQLWKLFLHDATPAQFLQHYDSPESAVEDYLENFIYSQVENLPSVIETDFGKQYQCPSEIAPLLLGYLKRHGA